MAADLAVQPGASCYGGKDADRAGLADAMLACAAGNG